MYVVLRVLCVQYNFCHVFQENFSTFVFFGGGVLHLILGGHCIPSHGRAMLFFVLAAVRCGEYYLELHVRCLAGGTRLYWQRV